MYQQGFRIQGPMIGAQQRMEEELNNNPCNPFLPIQKERSKDSVKQKIVEFRSSILGFNERLIKFNFQSKMVELHNKMEQISKCVGKDKNQEFESVTFFLLQLKEQYVNEEQQLKQAINNFSKCVDRFKFKQDDFSSFLKELKSIEQYYPQSQAVLILDNELQTFDILLTLLNPTQQNYKEIVYYEKAQSPYKPYKLQRKQDEISEEQIQKIMESLNMLYKLEAIPNQQERLVGYYNQMDKNLKKYQNYQEVILIVEIILEDRTKTCAVLIVYTHNNQKVSRSISQGKCREQLKSISNQLGCNLLTPMFIPNFSQKDAFNEFLKLVSRDMEMHKLVRFLQENEYYGYKDDQQVEIIDAFDMITLGFTPQFQIQKA